MMHVSYCIQHILFYFDSQLEYQNVLVSINDGNLESGQSSVASCHGWDDLMWLLIVN